MAMKLCPCGAAGRCVCAHADVVRYRSRLSGPLADRIDVHLPVGALPLRMLGDENRGEGSALIRARVEQARERQRQRGVSCNALATGQWISKHGKVSAEALGLLATGAERLGLSARGYNRVLKVARTIADLDGDERIGTGAITEALRYRPSVSAPESA